MKNLWLPFLALAVLPGCSSLKTAKINNYDDAYFTSADIDKPGIYGMKNPDAITANPNNGSNRNTRSYGQSYNDRFRSFGGTNLRPSYTPTIMVTPGGFGMGMMPYGYNPYMNPYMNPYYNPYMNPYMGYGMGYNPYMGGYYNSSWCYWNQYYSPYYNNYNYYGSSRPNYSSNSGSVWGGSKNAGSSSGSKGFVNNGVRRNSTNNGTSGGVRPSSSGGTSGSENSGSWGTGRTSSGSSTWSPGSSQSGGSGFGRATGGGGSSSGRSSGGGGGTSGTSGHRR